VPLHLTFSKMLKFGKLPVRIGCEANYYVEKPDAFGPEWSFSLNITPVVPNTIAKWLGFE
jgi:hypothetical protein